MFSNFFRMFQKGLELLIWFAWWLLPSDQQGRLVVYIDSWTYSMIQLVGHRAYWRYKLVQLNDGTASMLQFDRGTDCWYSLMIQFARCTVGRKHDS